MRPPKIPPAFLRGRACARHVGVSDAHFHKKIRRQLTPYPAGGRVTVYSVVELETLVRSGSLAKEEQP
jgi:hypothetical protein